MTDSAVGPRSGMLQRLAAPPIAIPLLGACGVLLFFVNLGGFALYTKGETREAVTILNMVHGHGFILPMRAGVEVPSKPLMMHWLAALVSLMVGQVNEWTVRLPSAVFAVLGVIICYYYVRLFFDQNSALIAALILATSCQYLQAAGARVDMTLTFFLEVAFFHFLALAEGLSKRTAPLYLAIAGAVLSKGPVGVALPVLVAVSWMVLTGRMALWRTLKLRRGILLVGVIAGSWYLAAIVSGGSAFVHKQLLAENLYRFFGKAGFNTGHAHPFYYMEAALAAGFMPWSPVIVLAVLSCRKWSYEIDLRCGYMLVWFCVVLLFYNMPDSKRGVYLLALYPALSTLCGLGLYKAIVFPSAAVERYAGMLGRIAGALLLVAGLSAIVGCVMLLYRPATLRWVLAGFDIRVLELPLTLCAAVSHHRLAVAALILVTILVGAVLAQHSSIEGTIGGIATGTIMIALSIHLVVEAAIASALSPRQFAISTRQRVGPGPIYYYGSLDYGFVYYSGGEMKLVSLVNLPSLIVGSEEEWPLMPQDFRAHYRVVLRSNPTELDGSGHLQLLSRTDAPP